jgi:large subunit ribosomal protein L30
MEKTKETGNKYLAVIRIRSAINATDKVKSILEHLRLMNKMMCSLYKDTPSIRGQIVFVKDYVAWGELNSEELKEIVLKKGKEFKGRTEDSKKLIKYRGYLSIGNKKYNSVLRLNSPRGGFEKKGIKKSFANGGALGYRKEKIFDLIKRMY